MVRQYKNKVNIGFKISELAILLSMRPMHERILEGSQGLLHIISIHYWKRSKSKEVTKIPGGGSKFFF